MNLTHTLLVCSGCKGEKVVRCMSFCPQCGGTGTSIKKALDQQVEVAKGRFTDIEGQRWEFERIGESR